MNKETENDRREVLQQHEMGILYNRVPQPGVVVQGYDINELLTYPHVQETEVDDSQREVGVSRAISFRPGIKDQFHQEYSEYMNFDTQNRPIATNRHQAGVFFTRFFEYDQLGRLAKRTDNEAYVYEGSQEFMYSSDTPDENGHFPFTVNQSGGSKLKDSI